MEHRYHNEYRNGDDGKHDQLVVQVHYTLHSNTVTTRNGADLFVVLLNDATHQTQHSTLLHRVLHFVERIHDPLRLDLDILKVLELSEMGVVLRLDAELVLEEEVHILLICTLRHDDTAHCRC